MKNLKKQRRDRQRGFTLTEIMVVVFIIGLLSTVVLINVTGAMSQGRTTKAATGGANCQVALLPFSNYRRLTDFYAKLLRAVQQHLPGRQGKPSRDEQLIPRRRAPKSDPNVVHC